MDLPNNSFTFSKIPSNVTVGKYTSIASHCFFHKGEDEHLYSDNKKCVFSYNWDQPNRNRPINIGSDVWIGYGVRVLSEINIGDGAIIGAGAVIAKDVPPYAVVVGNPQVIKRFRFSPDIIEKLLKIKWWDWPGKLPFQRKEDMKDIDIFLEKYYENN